MESLVHWIRYSRLFPYGSMRGKQLLIKIGSPERLDGCSDSQLTEEFGFHDREVQLFHRQTLEQAVRILEQCRKLGIWIISYEDQHYPARLRQLPNPPMVLYGKGQMDVLGEELILTVVGTRSSSDYGRLVTQKFCSELALAGMTILSGCAVGIDACAHNGAVSVGGQTIGMMGCGLDWDYPKENHELKERMLEKGALVSEYPPGVSPSGGNFPVRNRLMAGLGIGVFVTEAPLRSGSLITASQASEMGRRVFVVPPHHVLDARYGGLAQLLREGAKAVCNAGDILSEYLPLYAHKLNSEFLSSPRGGAMRSGSAGIQPPYLKRESWQQKKEKKQTQSAEKQFVLSSLSRAAQAVAMQIPQGIVQADELSVKAHLPIEKIMEALTELEMNGLIKSLPGQCYSWIEND